MSENDFSQLPVAGSDRKPIALLTIDSVARALRHFGTVPTALRVLDAMEESFRRCDVEDELFDVLDDLQRASAVLVLNRQQELAGIITSFDAMEFFRRRAQDIMLVQDIEETIKDFVLTSFRAVEEGVDHARLAEAIEAITASGGKQIKGPFKAAVRAFLAARGIASGPDDERILATVFEEHLNWRQPAKAFDRLTLNDYIELLLYQARWDSYGAALGVEREALRRLLQSVRDTRNNLSHFRTDIADHQRDQLFFCRDWLARHEEALKAAVAPQRSAQVGTSAVTTPHPPVTPQQPPDPAPLDEVDDSEASRYAALGTRLREATDGDRVVLTFAEIEKAIGAPLPASAREYRAWWSNNERGHTQAKQWLEAGWRVAEASPREQVVTFTKNKERETAYRRFFGGVNQKLSANGGLPPQRAPSGSSWHVVASAPETGQRSGTFVVSFARGDRLRIELYIQLETQQRTKRVFDAVLKHKAELEAAVGEPLSWERLDHRKASRVALYYPGSVLDAGEEMQSKAATAMVRFRTALAPVFEAALDEVAKVG